MSGCACNQLPTASTVTRAPPFSSSPSRARTCAASPWPWKVSATFGLSRGPLVTSAGSAVRLGLAAGGGGSALDGGGSGRAAGAGGLPSQPARGTAPSATAA